MKLSDISRKASGNYGWLNERDVFKIKKVWIIGKYFLYLRKKKLNYE